VEKSTQDGRNVAELASFDKPQITPSAESGGENGTMIDDPEVHTNSQTPQTGQQDVVVLYFFLLNRNCVLLVINYKQEKLKRYGQLNFY
jgi:hypothetical protein